MADIPRTEADLLTNFFQDGQGNNSITAQDFRDLIVSNKYLNHHGWEFDLDGEYTSGSPLFCPGSVRTQVTIDAAFGNFGHPPNEAGNSFWDVTENKIVPNGLNNFGLVRLSLTANNVSGPTNHFHIQLDVGGGSFPIIYEQVSVFAKGTDPQTFNYTIPLFSGPDFQVNGGKFYIIPDNDANVWQAAITSIALYIASPAIIISDATSLAFNGAGNPDTITRTGGTSFVTLGFREGQQIFVSRSENSGENDGVYTIASVTDTVITLVIGDSLTTNIEDTTAIFST